MLVSAYDDPRRHRPVSGHLAELAAQAEQGEEIVLSRDGHAVAVIRAAKARPSLRIGALAHLGPLTDEEANLFLEPVRDSPARRD